MNKPELVKELKKARQETEKAYQEVEKEKRRNLSHFARLRQTNNDLHAEIAALRLREEHSRCVDSEAVNNKVELAKELTAHLTHLLDKGWIESSIQDIGRHSLRNL